MRKDLRGQAMGKVSMGKRQRELQAVYDPSSKREEKMGIPWLEWQQQEIFKEKVQRPAGHATFKKKVQPEERHCYYGEKDPEILGLCLTNALRKATQSVNRSYLLNKLNKREGPSTQKSTGTKVAQVHCRSRKPL